MEIWQEYEVKIEHWRPIFGNQNHIDAVAIVGEINRMKKLHDASIARAIRNKNGELRKSKTRDVREKEMTILMRRVLELIN